VNWLLLTIVTIVSWGFVGFFIKLASKYSNWAEIYIVSNAVIFGVSLLVYVSQKPSLNVGSLGFNYALAAGVVSSLSVITFYLAVQGGKAIVVIPLTSLYPVVTIALSYLFLREGISFTKGLGIVLALVALVLVALD